MDRIIEKYEQGLLLEGWEQDTLELVKRIYKLATTNSTLAWFQHTKVIFIQYFQDTKHNDVIFHIGSEYASKYNCKDTDPLKDQFNIQESILFRDYIFFDIKKINNSAIKYLEKIELFEEIKSGKFYANLNTTTSNEQLLLNESDLDLTGKIVFIDEKGKVMNPEITTNSTFLQYPYCFGTSVTINNKKLLGFLGNDIDQPKKVQLKPLIASQYLKLLPDGSGEIKLNKSWTTFAKLKLKISKGLITTNSGKLLFTLINLKREFPGASSFSFNMICNESKISSTKLKTAVEALQRSIRNHKAEELIVIKYDSEYKKVVLLHLPINRDDILKSLYTNQSA